MDVQEPNQNNNNNNHSEEPPTKKPRIEEEEQQQQQQENGATNQPKQQQQQHKKKNKKRKNFKKRENEWNKDSSNLWVHARDRNNTLFEKYYDLQFSSTIANWEKEREEFFTALKTPLPQTFRISEAIEPEVHGQIRNRIETEFVPDIEKIQIEDEVEDESVPITEETTKRPTKKITRTVPPPKPIQWYPNNTDSPIADKYATRNSAWYFGVTKALLRKNPTLQKFRAFLMSQTERGNVSRQEEVSMLPPMFFFSGMKPEDRVLDMCAAPGSKTAQLVEMLYASSRKYQRPITGYVVGNDNDVKRAYLLVHQMQRLSNIFPNIIITNHDATQYPLLTIAGEKKKFTKILCDVMCTGDGTLRKSPDLWKRWKPNLAWALHEMQIRCVIRAFQICEVGGTIVYSTCSLNPIEDEAAVAEIIRQSNYNLELVDAAKELPNLKYSPGMTSWTVTNSKSEPVTLEQYQEFFKLSIEQQETFKEKLSPKITKSMFPPTEEEIKKMNLHYGMRLLPNRMDTGGFFVAVFKKVGDMKIDEDTRMNEVTSAAAESTTATDATASKPAEKETIRGYKGKATQNEQFVPANEKVLERVYQYYGIDKNIIPPEQLIIRASEAAEDKKDITIDNITEDDIKKIYYVSKGVREIIEANATQQKWKLVNLGVRMFERKKTTDFMPRECPFRFTQDFADQFAHAISPDRLIKMNKEDFVLFLKQLTTLTEDIKEEKVKEQVKQVGGGSVIVEYVPDVKNETTSGIYIAALKTQNNLMRHCSREYVRAIMYRVDPTIELEEHDKPNIPKQRKNKHQKKQEQRQRQRQQQQQEQQQQQQVDVNTMEE